MFKNNRLESSERPPPFKLPASHSTSVPSLVFAPGSARGLLKHPSHIPDIIFLFGCAVWGQEPGARSHGLRFPNTRQEAKIREEQKSHGYTGYDEMTDTQAKSLQPGS